MEEQSVWRRRRRRSNGRAVMRCVSDAFSDCAVLAAAPVNHDYNGEERWEQWCRKSRSDNYNARDKIMGTRCTLPIISCISSRLTPPPHTPPSPPLPYWQPAITGYICEIQNELIWWQQWGLWSRLCVCTCLCAEFCQMSKNIDSYFSGWNKHMSVTLWSQDEPETSRECVNRTPIQDLKKDYISAFNLFRIVRNNTSRFRNVHY